jgi:hypothetical protein
MLYNDYLSGDAESLVETVRVKQIAVMDGTGRGRSTFGDKGASSARGFAGCGNVGDA